MFDLTATTAPALALKGAAAVVAAMETSGTAETPAFPALLANLAKSAELTPQPETAEPLPLDAAAAQAVVPGKTGSVGNATGKLLPPGKLPLARKAAVEAESEHADGLLDETEQSGETPDLTAFATLASPLPPPGPPVVGSQPKPERTMSPGSSPGEARQPSAAAAPTSTSSAPADPAAVEAVGIPVPSQAVAAVASDPAPPVSAPVPRLPEIMVALLAQAPMPSTDRSGSAPLPPQEPAETDAPAPALQLAATGTEATERKIASAPRLAAEPLVTPAQDQATPASVPVETRAPAPAPSAPSPSAAPAQQDLAALIDRIVEARAAAAPQTVRASLVHEDFGSVSLNFRSEQAHIHVTLGSADPGFAPAVQAAAAATLSAETRGEPDRRDHSAQQQPGPETAAHGNPSSPQNGAQERPSTEGRAAARKHGFEQPASRSSDNTPTHPAPHRRSGIYA